MPSGSRPGAGGGAGRPGPRAREARRPPRADREDDRVELGAQLLGRDVAPDVHAEAPLDALVRELAHAPLDDPLLDLEVRHAEAHEPAAGLVALEEHDAVADPAELLRGRHPGRPAADHGDAAVGLDA